MSATRRRITAQAYAALTCLSLAAGGAVAASATTETVDRAAETYEAYTSNATVATNIPQVHTFVDAPKGFDPLTAGTAELAAYGFPPRPDSATEPEHYALWRRAMAAARIRWHGALKPITTPKTPEDAVTAAEEMSPEVTVASATKATSKNWGGLVLTKSLTKWNSGQSFRDIYSVMTVPVGQPAFASICDSYFSRTFVGLNGYVKGAALQPGAGQGSLIGGFQTLTDCSKNDSFYYAIFGWDPGYIQGAFSVQPGDLVYTEVTSPPHGVYDSYLFIEDLTTLSYSAYSIPVQYAFVGNSAEWVVERPCCEFIGIAYPLVNSIDTFFDGGAAIDNAGQTLYPGSQASSAQVITMQDDAGDQTILNVYTGSSGSEGLHALRLETTGCAYTGGCVK
jgi:hypothetical protein